MAFGDDFKMNRSSYLKLMAGDLYQKASSFTVPPISNETINDIGDTSIIAATLAGQADYIGRQALRQHPTSGTSTMADNVNATLAKTESNWWDQTMNFISGIGNSVMEGILSFADALGDAAISFGSFFTEDDTWAEDAIKHDWVSPTVKMLDTLNNKFFNPVYWMTQGAKGTAESSWNEMWNTSNYQPEKARELLEEERADTYLPEEARNIIYGTSKAVGNMLPSIALATATGGASLWAQIGAQAGLGALQGYGGGVGRAVEEGAELHEAAAYGAIQGSIQGVAQGVSAGIGGVYASKGTQGIMGVASKKIGSGVATGVSKLTGQAVNKSVEVLAGTTAKVLLNAGAEGVETFIEESLDPAFKQITYDQQAWEKAYGTSEAASQTFAQAGQAALISTIAAGIFEAGRTGYDYKADKNAFIQGYYNDKAMGLLGRKGRKIAREAMNGWADIQAEQATFEGLMNTRYQPGNDDFNAEITRRRSESLSKLDRMTREYNEKFSNPIDAFLQQLDTANQNGSELQTKLKEANANVPVMANSIDDFKSFLTFVKNNDQTGRIPLLNADREAPFRYSDDDGGVPSSPRPTPDGTIPSSPDSSLPRLEFNSRGQPGRKVVLTLGRASDGSDAPVLKPKSSAAVAEALGFVETHPQSVSPKVVEFDARAIDQRLRGTIVAKPTMGMKGLIGAMDLQLFSGRDKKPWSGKVFPSTTVYGEYYYFASDSSEVKVFTPGGEIKSSSMEDAKKNSIWVRNAVEEFEAGSQGMEATPENLASVVSAPYYQYPVTESHTAQDHWNEISGKYFEKVEDIAKAMELEIEWGSSEKNLGSFTFEDGKTMKEISATFRVKNYKSFEDVQRFASLVADLAGEQQEAVIATKIITDREELKLPDAVFESIIPYRELSPMEVQTKILEPLGIQDNTVRIESQEISLIYFKDDDGKIDVEKSNDVAQKVIEALGENYDRYTNRRKGRYIRSSYLDTGARERLYKAWLGRNEGGVRGARLRDDYIRPALQKIADWRSGVRPRSRIEEANRPRKTDARVANASKVFTGEKDPEVLKLAESLKPFEQPENLSRLAVARNKKTGKTSLVEDEASRPFFALADAIYEKTAGKVQQIQDLLRKVSSETGVSWDLKNAQTLQKTRESIADRLYRNIADGKGADPYTLKDWARSTFIFDESTVGNLPKVVEALKPYLERNASGKLVDVKRTPYGYLGIHLNLNAFDIPTEIQLHTAESWKVKLELEEAYNTWRSRKDELTLSEEKGKGNSFKEGETEGRKLLDDPLFKKLREEASSINSSNRLPEGEQGEDGDGKKGGDRIEIGMSDDERAEFLKHKKIKITEAAHDSRISKDSLGSATTKHASEAFTMMKKILGDDFPAPGVFKNIGDSGLSAFFSNKSMRESINKSKDLQNEALALENIESILNEAVTIEKHRPQPGKKNDKLKDVTEMVSAFQDGKSIIPVKITIKHFDSSVIHPYILYIVAAMNKLKNRL